MTAPVFDGTFSTEAVAGVGLALVERLYEEAMATIAALAENWDSPVEEATAVVDDEPVSFVEPASWSADDDEDDVPAPAPVALPALVLRSRRAAATAATALAA